MYTRVRWGPAGRHLPQVFSYLANYKRSSMCATYRTPFLVSTCQKELGVWQPVGNCPSIVLQLPIRHHTTSSRIECYPADISLRPFQHIRESTRPFLTLCGIHKPALRKSVDQPSVPRPQKRKNFDGNSTLFQWRFRLNKYQTTPRHHLSISNLLHQLP